MKWCRFSEVLLRDGMGAHRVAAVQESGATRTAMMWSSCQGRHSSFVKCCTIGVACKSVWDADVCDCDLCAW